MSKSPFLLCLAPTWLPVCGFNVGSHLIRVISWKKELPKVRRPEAGKVLKEQRWGRVGRAGARDGESRDFSEEGHVAGKLQRLLQQREGQSWQGNSMCKGPSPARARGTGTTHSAGSRKWDGGREGGSAGVPFLSLSPFLAPSSPSLRPSPTLILTELGQVATLSPPGLPRDHSGLTPDAWSWEPTSAPRGCVPAPRMSEHRWREKGEETEALQRHRL